MEQRLKHLAVPLLDRHRQLLSEPYEARAVSDPLSFCAASSLAASIGADQSPSHLDPL